MAAQVLNFLLQKWIDGNFLMSALGHKRTTHPRPKSTVVRYGPITDKRGRGWIVH